MTYLSRMKPRLDSLLREIPDRWIRCQEDPDAPVVLHYPAVLLLAAQAVPWPGLTAPRALLTALLDRAVERGYLPEWRDSFLRQAEAGAPLPDLVDETARASLFLKPADAAQLMADLRAEVTPMEVADRLNERGGADS